MRWSIAATAVLFFACNRSDLLDRTVCDEAGSYVVVENHAFCVFPGTETFACPDELPFSVRFAESGFCAIEESPPEPLLGAALNAALEIDAGVVDAGAGDGALFDGGAADFPMVEE